MLNIFLYLWSVHETKKKFVWLIDWIDWLCACKKKKLEFPYLPNQNVLTDFCQILHNSNPQRKWYILDGFSLSVVVFYLQRGQICHIPFHILCEWLLTQCSALPLPCIRVIYVTLFAFLFRYFSSQFTLLTSFHCTFSTTFFLYL